MALDSKQCANRLTGFLKSISNLPQCVRALVNPLRTVKRKVICMIAVFS